MQNHTWKSSESKIGIWYGAKGIKNSGRQPLSGGNSGVTRGDAPHPTIFIESKRDKSYHSVIKLYREYKKVNDKFILSLPEVENNRIINRFSDIVCIHNSIFFNVSESIDEFDILEWKGGYPRALTLYEESILIKNSSSLDANKQIVTVNLVYHGHPGFYIIINKNDIVKCSNLIIEARKVRERLIEEEKQWAVDAAVADLKNQ